MDADDVIEVIDRLPEPPDWLPLEKYGIGIPATLGATGLILLFLASRGIGKWDSLTWYGNVGAAVIFLVGVSAVTGAGYTYAVMETTWWLQTEEEDAQTPVSFDESGE